MTTPLVEQTLGQLASQIPGATRLFRDHRLDFCCGGDQSLRHAASARGLDAEQLAERLAEISRQPGQDTDWNQQPTAALIAHILTRYHARHRQQLEELTRLADRVEQVHGTNPACPRGLGDFLAVLGEELDNHMQKEEQVLFPMLEQGYGAMADGPISVMRYEHDQHGDALERLLELSHGLQLPEHACNTWRALYRGLEELYDDLMEHIHLENNILFLRQ